MATGKRLVKNTITLFICQVTMVFLSSIFIVFLARLLGPANYGKYVFVTTFPVIFFVAMDFLTELATRNVARDKTQASSYLGATLLLKTFFFPLLFFAIYVSIRTMGYPQDIAIAVYVLSLYVFLQKLSASFSAIFVANEKLGYSSISAVVEKLIIVSLALWFVYSGGGLTTFVWAFVVGSAFRFLVLGGLVKKYAQLKAKLDLSLCQHLFKSGYPILIMSFFVVFISKIEVVFLSKMQDDYAVGLYGIGHNLYIVVAIIATSLVGSLFPVFSKYSYHAQEKAFSLYKVSFRLLFATAVLIMVGMLALADRVILFLFKEAYIGSVAVLKIIFLALPLFFLRNLLAAILFSVDRQKQVMGVFGLSFLFNLILCITMIPRFSYFGAAITFALSECVVFSGLFYLTSKYFCKIDLLAILGKTAIAGLITYLVLLYLINLRAYLI